MVSVEEFCEFHLACQDGTEWARAECCSMDEVWQKAKPEWLVWVATRPGVATPKERRLLAAIAARSVSHLMMFSDSSDAVETAERYAHGTATDDERAAALIEARTAARDAEWDAEGGAAAGWAAAEAAAAAVTRDATRAAAVATRWAARAASADAARAATRAAAGATRWAAVAAIWAVARAVARAVAAVVTRDATRAAAGATRWAALAASSDAARSAASDAAWDDAWKDFAQWARSNIQPNFTRLGSRDE